MRNESKTSAASIIMKCGNFPSFLTLPRSVSEDNVEVIREIYQKNLHKSVRRESFELGLPRSTVGDISHKRLKLFIYRPQFGPEDKKHRIGIGENILL
jgi:hypothetical protein